MKNRRFGAAIFAMLLVLPMACSGPGGHAGSVIPGASAPGAAKQSFKLKIKIPKRVKASKRRHGHYVSPSTTQMLVNVTDDASNELPGYPMTASLTPTSAGCTSTLANTLCQLSLPLAPGSYLLSLRTLDAPGQTLSIATEVPITIVAGNANTASVALYGAPHAITASQLGAGSQSFLLNALDVDGNPIVGAGAPAFTVAATSGIPVTISQPTSTTPNTFSVGTTGSGTAALTVTASFGPGNTGPCDQNGAVCTAQFTLTSGAAQQNLFVASDSGGLVEFAPPYTGAPVATNTKGMAAARQIAFAPNGDLFVANSGTDSGNANVAAYAPGFTAAPLFTNTSLAVPSGVAFDSSGNLFISDASFPLVQEYAPAYIGAPTRSITDVGEPAGLAFDASNDLFSADFFDGIVYELAGPIYTSPPIAITDGVVSPQGIMLDPSGNLFVANSNNTVTEYAPPFTNASTPILTIPVNSATYLAMDASNNLYVASINFGDPAIQVYAPPYNGSPSQTLRDAQLASPEGLAFHTVYSLSISQ